MKRKKAQQIVEFLLVAPFVIGFLAFFTEYAFALNINLTLTKALKESTSKIYQYSRPNMTQKDITDYVKDAFEDTLKKNGVPVKEKNNIRVGYFKTKNVGIFTAQYTYYPAFSLPSIFFDFMPDKFNFVATVPVPLALLKSNNYSNTVSTNSLDAIWQASTFSTLEFFDGHKNGIMENTASGKDKILFLIQTNEFGVSNTYFLTDWDGVPKSAPEEVSSDSTSDEADTESALPSYYVYTKGDKNLSSCSGSTCKKIENYSLYDYLTRNGKTYIYVVNSTFKTSVTTNNIEQYWFMANNVTENPMSVNNISALDYSGLLKNVLALVSDNSKAIGSYESNLSCKNSEACNSSSMNIYPFGSMIFVDSSSTIRDSVTSGEKRPK